MPDNDTTEEIGGAIDLSRKFEFTDLAQNGLVQAVSSNAGDTTQTITVHYKNIAGLLSSEVKTLTGLTPIAFVATMKSLMKAIKSATTAGDIALEAVTAERTNTAQGPGSSTDTIQLDTGASAVNGFFNGMVCRITGGTGAGQIRRVINYTGSSKEAILDRDWDVVLDSTSIFRLSRGMVFEKAPDEAMEVRAIHYDARSDDLAGTQAQYYEKVFVKNTHPTETLSVAILTELSNPSGNIAFGLAASLNDSGTNGVGNNRQAFTSPPTFDNADKSVVGGVLAPGDIQGIWLRLMLDPAETGQKSEYSLRLNGEVSGPPAAGMRVKTGTYVGDGTGPKAITGLGFAPVSVFLVRSNTEFCWKSPMSGANTYRLNSGADGLLPDRIDSLDGDGFTAGTLGNVSAASYFWCAFGADTAVFFQSSYVGTGSAHGITGIGFQPDFVLVVDSAGLGAFPAVGKMASSGGTLSHLMRGAFQLTDAIISLDADGFSVGADTNAAVNVNLRDYFYLALKSTLSNVFQDSYVGDGLDNKNIVQGDPFAPEMLITIHREEGLTRGARLRFASAALDQSWEFSGTSAGNRIQDFNPDGFEVGTNVAVNENLMHFDYLSLTDVPPSPPETVVGPVAFASMSWDLSLPLSESATIVDSRRLLESFSESFLDERTIIASAPPLASFIDTRSIFRAFLPFTDRRTIVPRSVMLKSGMSESGEAQGGTLTTIILAPDASSTNGFYVGMWITIDGDVRQITAYNGGTRTATVATLTAPPIAGTPYSITVARPGASKVLRPFATVTES
jgi:hypothetical protein